ncbi:MAG: hypothetical protein REI78_07045 [Pedobacter sp.]|nr:hypothetical protein [Pedobacter sp.]
MDHHQPEKDLPPFAKSWPQFYLLLVIWLMVLIGAFYAFTLYFA